LYIPVAWFSQRRQGIFGWADRKTYCLETYYGKGGSAFIPTLKGGVFPLRPLHPREIKFLSQEVLSIIREKMGHYQIKAAGME